MSFIKNKNKKLFILIFLICLIIPLVMFLNPKTIKIGLITSFIETESELEINGRNGALLAIEEINNNGGIKGRKLELLVGNYKSNIKNIEVEIKNLLENNISILVGPFLSNMGNYVLEALEGYDLLVLSPTIKSDKYKNIDDKLICVSNSASKEGMDLGSGIILRGDKRVALLWSDYNNSFTKPVSEGIKSKLKKQNINIVYDSVVMDKDDIPNIVNKLIELEVDAVSIIGRGDFVAAITQQFYTFEVTPHFYSSEWARVTNVLEYGGRSVEGMVLYDLGFSSTNKKELYSFNKRYKERFFQEPSTPAKLSYESIMVFYEAMLETKGSDDYVKLKSVITSGKEFKGLTNSFYFNKYGDVVREGMNLYIIENGAYVHFEE